MLLLGFVASVHGQAAAPLKLIQKIPVPDVAGDFDHMAIDIQGQRLFVPAEEHSTVEVVDLRAGKRIRTISDVSWPSTVAYNPRTNTIFVTDRSGGSIKVFSGETYELVKAIKLITGPDNATYDPATQYFYSVSGGQWLGVPYTLIAIIDTATKEHLGDIRVESANIQAMAIEPGTGPKKMYADMADKDQIAVIDLQKRAVISTWPTSSECQQPEAAAVDAAHHRLFVGSRMKPHTGEIGGGHQYEPGKLVVMDTETGKVVQVLDSVGGADDLQYDAATSRIYFVGTTGTVAVFKEIDPDHYSLLGKVPTGALAKTGLWVPELKRMYIAVPKHLVQTPPYGANDHIVEEAHLMVFEYVP